MLVCYEIKPTGDTQEFLPFQQENTRKGSSQQSEETTEIRAQVKHVKEQQLNADCRCERKEQGPDPTVAI